MASVYDDDFNDNSLDPKWTSETDTNVVLAEAGSEIQITKTGAHNEYGHIQQACAHDNITAIVKLKINNAISIVNWSAGLVLYWDVDNHASIMLRYHASTVALRHIWGFLNNASTVGNFDLTQAVTIGTYYWVKIELTSTQIKYYTSTDGVSYSLRSTQTRNAGQSGAPALFILGAGWSDNPTYPNADWDNSEAGTNNLGIRIDEFLVEGVPTALASSNSIVPIMKGLGMI